MNNTHPIFAGLCRALSGDATRAAVDGRAARATGNHRVAQNDEPEPMPSLEEIDAAMHEDKLRNRYDSKREESAGLSFTERELAKEFPK